MYKDIFMPSAFVIGRVEELWKFNLVVKIVQIVISPVTGFPINYLSGEYGSKHCRIGFLAVHCIPSFLSVEGADVYSCLMGKAAWQLISLLITLNQMIIQEDFS